MMLFYLTLSKWLSQQFSMLKYCAIGWRQEKKGTKEDEIVGRQEDEIVGRHHRLNRHESKQAPGVGDGQGTCLLHGVAKSQTRPRD